MNQEYPESIKEQSIHLSRVRDSNYKKADLEQEVKKSIHLTKLKWLILLIFLKKYEDIFDSNLGEWIRPPVDIPIKGEAKPYYEHVFPIPVIHL